MKIIITAALSQQRSRISKSPERDRALWGSGLCGFAEFAGRADQQSLRADLIIGAIGGVIIGGIIYGWR